jgi:hypothetical protein
VHTEAFVVAKAAETEARPFSPPGLAAREALPPMPPEADGQLESGQLPDGEVVEAERRYIFLARRPEVG